MQRKGVPAHSPLVRPSFSCDGTISDKGGSFLFSFHITRFCTYQQGYTETRVEPRYYVPRKYHSTMPYHGNSYRADAHYSCIVSPHKVCSSQFLRRIFMLTKRKKSGKYALGGFGLAIYVFSRPTDSFPGATQGPGDHTLWRHVAPSINSIDML